MGEGYEPGHLIKWYLDDSFLFLEQSNLSFPVMIKMSSSPRFLTTALFSCLIVAASVIPRMRAGSLLITHTPPDSLTCQCLRSSYLGAFGVDSETQDQMYDLDTACLLLDGALDSTLVSVDAGTVVQLPIHEDGRIIWVGQAGVDPSLATKDDTSDDMERNWEIIADRAASLISTQDQAQHVVSAFRHHELLTLLHASRSSLLIHVPPSFLPIIDTLLPPHLVPIALSTGSTFRAVPPSVIEQLANHTAKLQFSPQLDRITTEGIKLDEIRRTVRWLTGEAPSGIESRHSFTAGAIKAGHWIKGASNSTTSSN